MKKLALIVTIAALSMVMLAVSASAGGEGWKNFQGTYEMVASGSCIHSQNGYDATLTAIRPGVVYAGATVWNGSWIFNKGGKGTYSYNLYATVTPPPLAEIPPGMDPIPGGIRIFTGDNVPFDFVVTPFGDITVTTGGLVLTGSISQDKKTMTLLSANTVQNFVVFPFWYTICNTARTLIKVGD